MPVDKLALKLQELLERGSVPCTQVSERMRTRLETLFRIGAIVEVTAGRGRRIELRDQKALATWIRANYPFGLIGTDTVLSARAESVANCRNTKRGRSLEIALVHMRGFGQSRLVRSDIEQPIATMTAAFGVAGVVIDPARPWQMVGTLGLVENMEVFMQVERIEPALDAALWSSGPLGGHILTWLQRQTELEVVHFGDYDPVGLSEYLRFRKVLGARVKLYVPADLEARLMRFGQRELLEKSSSVLARVRQEADEAVRAVLSIIERHGLGLEHEALLIPVDSGSRSLEPYSTPRMSAT